MSFLTASLSVYSDTFPRGCVLSGYGQDQNHVVFNQTGKQSYFLVQNNSSKTINLQRIEVHGAFLSPALSIQLESNQWAAFASNIANFYFECVEKNKIEDEDNYQQVSCQNVLNICEYPHVRFALSNQGNYWVSSNKSLHDVIQESVAKGIYLKW